MTRAYRWVNFIGDLDELKVNRYITSGTDHLNRYRVRQVVPIRGEPPTVLSEGMYGLRYETSVPPSFLTRGTSLGQSPKMHFWGVAQHLHYTSQKERIDLEAHSYPELTPSEHTIAVLIPIRKSAAWWDLSQDDRQEFFHKKAGQEGHIAIGA
ncbi:MAG: hypothetical protein L0Y56_02900, partial [Nitrospira sp.]|nr:hypothetical protein [Nitrospira sp.]